MRFFTQFFFISAIQIHTTSQESHALFAVKKEPFSIA